MTTTAATGQGGFVGITKVTGIKYQRNRLGPFLPNGERTGVPIEGSDFDELADTVILAVGQRPDTSFVDIDLEKTEKIFTKTRTGLRIPLRRHITGTLEITHEYDSGSADSTEDEDWAYSLKLGYEW